MVQLVKKEWHQVCSEYSLDFDSELLGEIYPDKSEEELEQFLIDLENGIVEIEILIEDAINNDVELEWEHMDDDWWTHRKGGYDVTYELGEE